MNGRRPTRVTGVMLMVRDPARADAAWGFIRFVTSAEGTTLMVKNSVCVTQVMVDKLARIAEQRTTP